MEINKLFPNAPTSGQEDIQDKFKSSSASFSTPYLLVHLDVQPVRHFVVLREGGEEKQKHKDQSKVSETHRLCSSFLFLAQTPKLLMVTLGGTHHDIVSLHLGFLAGQFLTLHFQTARQKRHV